MSRVPTLTPASFHFNADGTLVSNLYNDIYHTAAGAIGQARHVFLHGNRLPERWHDHAEETFTLVETGFGAGINFLLTWDAWRQRTPITRPQRLHFISVEKHPFTQADLETLHSRWPEFAQLSQQLCRQWPVLLPGFHRLEFSDDNIILTLALGDGAALLQQTVARAHAFYLDGFAPAKNPEIWSQATFSALARLAAPGATLATWSVAAEVRHGLRQAGFVCEKAAGFADKRDMLTAHYEPWPSARLRHPPRPVKQFSAENKRASIVGAGVAGCSVASRLASRGWQVDIYEADNAPGQRASGNLAGIMRPHLANDDNPLARLSRAAFLYGLRHLHALSAQGKPLRWQACGAVHLARDDEHEQRLKNAALALQAPSEFVTYLDAEAMSQRVGQRLARGGWYFPQGGWVSPRTLCPASLDHPLIRLHTDSEIARFTHQDNQWHLLDSKGLPMGSAPVLVLATGAEACAEIAPLPLRFARGQVDHVSAHDLAWTPRQVFCGSAYITPPVDGICCVGATMQLDCADQQFFERDTQENLANLAQLLPDLLTIPLRQSTAAEGRVGLRPLSVDRLPLLGLLPDFDRIRQRHDYPADLAAIPRCPDLYLANGFGTRGIVWSALAGELLACQINGEPLPIEKDLVNAVDPARFLLRPQWRQRFSSLTAVPQPTMS